ncbi:hypothetical protein [Hutsoniella sourekii]|uniref:hypothetical protein n=1 Tax=Hutsoniella sourekii TaxID=87650 RepID=UPI00048252C7|nr:hypothetical protein [Hutsoniella sourekii]
MLVDLKVFGFDEAASMFDNYASKSSNAKPEFIRIAEDMHKDARSNFQSGLRQHTGQGASGIQIEKSAEEATIGWSGRPGLHGYFHELGFHALDNRFGRQRVARNRTGKRKRRYRKRQATYVPPTPHMRPAFYAHQGSMQGRIQKAIT